jgi:hypothetical protein
MQVRTCLIRLKNEADRYNNLIFIDYLCKFTDIQTYDDQQHKGKSGTTTEKHEEQVRKDADDKFKAALIKALEEITAPGNKYAENMVKLQKHFNGLKPTANIHKEFEALYKEVFGATHNPTHSHREHAEHAAPIEHTGSSGTGEKIKRP